MLARLMICFALGLFAAAVGAQTFNADDIRNSIEAARKKPGSPSGLGPLGAPSGAAVEEGREARAREEREARFKLLSTCDGRFNALRTTQHKQVRRSEWIASFGGLVGVLGAVATCPQCAALAAGVAGLANPLQQTFRDNYDTPQHTQDTLDKLWVKIDAEIAEYKTLPAADPADSSTFEANLQKRLDTLLYITASCSYYTTTLNQAVSEGK